MHIIKSKYPIPMGRGISLEPGTYVVEDMDAVKMIQFAGAGRCELTYFETNGLDAGERNNPPPSWEEESFTVIRPGRFGDLILLTPCLRELKKRFPRCSITVSCLPHYRDILIGLPYIDRFLPYPLPLADIPSGAIYSLESMPDYSEKEKSIHITDLFAERLNLGKIEDGHPDVFLTEDELKWARDAYPRKDGHPRIAIQIKSSTPSRDYPFHLISEVISKLVERKWEVVLLGTSDQISGESELRIVNCAKDNLTIRQSAAVLATADVFLGPDSVMIHIAGAIGIPAVGLFSVVPWNLRTSYHSKTFVIQSKKGCDIAPCFHAPRGAIGWPTNGPCNKDRFCSALATIEPDEVVGRIEQYLKR